MPRPRKRRHLCFCPQAIYFKPRGVPMRHLEEVILWPDEIEAIKLKDFEGLDQMEAARKMRISQSTFQRTLAMARIKISKALIGGRALRIEKRLRPNDRI